MPLNDWLIIVWLAVAAVVGLVELLGWRPDHYGDEPCPLCAAMVGLSWPLAVVVVLLVLAVSFAQRRERQP